MSTNKVKILVIDDQPDNLTTMMAILNEALPGSETHCASSGTQGLELALKHDHDVILLDILMPIMDGYEVCRHLKNQSKVCDIPVVFLTAQKSSKECRIKALECGAEAFLNKPVDLSELIALIRTMLKVKTMNRSKSNEKEKLEILVHERTSQLEHELQIKTHMEAALKESEEKYRAIYENSHIAILLTIPDGHIIAANDYAREIFGMNEQEIIDTGRDGIIDTDDPRFPLLLKERAETGYARGLLTLKRKNGERFLAEVNSKIFIDYHGNKRNSMVIRDMSRLQKTEEVNKILNHRLHILIKAIQKLSDSNTEADVRITVCGVARNLLNAKGSSFVLLDGGNCYYAEEESTEPLWKGERFPIDNCISGWSMKNRESVMIPDIYKDDRIPLDYYSKTYVKSLIMTPIIIEQPVGAIGVYWDYQYQPDYTEKKLLQTLADAAGRAIERINLVDNLEKMVNERTAQLAAANKELESFSVSASHDLQAPLRRIHGFTQILLEEYAPKFDAEGIKLCHSIEKNTKRLGQLVSDLLNFSSYGRGGLNMEEINMTQLVKDVFNEIKEAKKYPAIQLKIKKLPGAKADAMMIRQVWYNLLDNALKYSSQCAKPEITIDSEKRAGFFAYSIKDNGVGFEAKYADKIFDVFQRLHDEAEYDGTGVGLAIVERIIERHGGTIRAESQTGKGAIFTFTIPA